VLPSSVLAPSTSVAPKVRETTPRASRNLDRSSLRWSTPLVAKAQEKVDARPANKEFAHVWANTEVYADLQDMLNNVKPTAVFIGVPPSFLGCYKYPLELQVLRAGAHLFVEKPLSNAPVDEVINQVRAGVTCHEAHGLLALEQLLDLLAEQRVAEHVAHGHHQLLLLAEGFHLHANIPSPF
jgi:hypothetical protein